MPENNKRRWSFAALQDKRSKIILFVIFFAAIGTAALLFTRAATPAASIEAENGALTGGAGVVGSSSDASGNSYVKFGADTCTTFSGPITITDANYRPGGIYTGCWETTDGITPAIKIRTTQPVIIANSIIKGNFMLINDGVAGVNLTVTRSSLIGTTPGDPAGVSSRRAVRLGSGAANFRFENNYLENNSGIKITGWANAGTSTSTITVLRNRAKNITGEHLTADSNDKLVQFFQLGQIRQISHVEIAWNEVINEYQKSKVEDNINFYQTGGTSASHIRVHDNFIWGGFPLDYSATFYRGGGIIAGDSSHGLDVGWVDIYNNQVVGTTNYGVSIVCGHDSTAYGNRVISSGLTPSGQRFATANVGLSGNSATAWDGRCDVGNYGNAGDADHNVFRDNYVGWMNHNNVRKDMTFRCGESTQITNDNPPPSSITVLIECADNINNTSVQPANSSITYAMEQAEFTRWQQKLLSNSVVVGP